MAASLELEPTLQMKEFA